MFITDQQLSDVEQTQPLNHEEVKKVLVVDKSTSHRHLVRDCVEDEENHYEIRSAIRSDQIEKTLKSFSPNLVVADWDTIVVGSLEEILSQFPLDQNTPILLLVDEKDVSSESIWKRFSSALVDYVRKPIVKAELKTRIKLLLRFTKHLDNMRDENKSIREELKQEHFELHLKLLMHSGSTKDKFLQDVAQLSSYLNDDGKMKLKNLTRQFRWALSEENSVNSLIAFDKLNESLYQKIEGINQGITRNENRLCALLLKNPTGAEIAKIMGKTQNCINVAFARLRIKMKTPNNKALRLLILSIS